MKRLLRLITAVVLAAASTALPQTSTVALAAECQHDSVHYYAQALSGYSNSVSGTGAWTTSWSTWYVSTSNGFSDVAVWLWDDSGHFLEGGFYTGAGVTVPWTNSMLPYYTLDNGQHEHDYAGDVLTTNANTWMEVHDQPSTYSTYVKIQSFYLYPGTYTMLTPRHNFSQGEVATNTSTWMGGSGSGETFSGLWSDSGGSWHYWGFHNDCANTPYWIKSVSSDSWTIGGR